MLIRTSRFTSVSFVKYLEKRRAFIQVPPFCPCTDHSEANHPRLSPKITVEPRPAHGWHWNARPGYDNENTDSSRGSRTNHESGISYHITQSLTPQTPLPPATPTHSPPCAVSPLGGAQLRLATSYSQFQLAAGPLMFAPAAAAAAVG